MANTGRLAKASFKKESSWGVKVTPDKPMSLTSESLANKVQTVEDGRLIDRVFTSNMIKIGEQVEGAVETTLHPEEAGNYMYYALGVDTTSRAPVGGIVIYYNGTDAYADVECASGVMTGSSGATVGTKAQAWQFDMSNASYDTLAELAAAIEAVAYWTCKAFGNTAAASLRIMDFAATQLDGAMFQMAKADGILITYTGADAYADVVKSGASIVGASGANVGAKVQAWTFDTTNVSYDILTELVAGIDAVADWTCTLVGTGSTLSSLLGTIALTVLTTNVPSYFGAVAAYMHTITPAGAAANIPSFTTFLDRGYGTGKAIGLAGCKLTSVNLGINARAIITASLNVSGKVETITETYPTLTIPADNPYVGNKASVFINGYLMGELKTLAMNINNNLAVDGVVGSDYIIEQDRQDATIEISGSLNLSSAVYDAQYPLYTANTPLEMVIVFEHIDNATTSSGQVPYFMALRVPAVKFTDWNGFASGPDRMTANFTGMAVYDTAYEQIEISVTDKQSVYN